MTGAYRWPTVNVWYCGHCGKDLGRGPQPKQCSNHKDVKHAYMIEKTEYLELASPHAKAGDGERETAAPRALPKGSEERPNTEQLPKEG